METPDFILPLATDVSAVQAQKAALLASTANPVVRTVLYQVIRTINDAIARALAAPLFSGNSIEVSIDPTILARPQFSRVTAYLTARGFTSVINAESLTVSW